MTLERSVGFVIAVLAALGCASSGARERAGERAGALVIVGGGGTTAPILARALELAAGPRTKVVVLPQASSVERRGEESAQMWRDAGAAEARVVEFADLAAAQDAIRGADLVWIGGGDQNRFMKEALEAGLAELLVERHRAGAVFGGTSAGAAVMTQRMITGDPENAVERLAPGSVGLDRGLGLLPGALVDQHFVVRRRNNRLLSAVLERPAEVGFGIDERTALIVLPERFEVLGEGPVVVFDAREAQVAAQDSGPVWSTRGVKLSVLRQGDSLPRR
jgi:cyanophycinase